MMREFERETFGRDTLGGRHMGQEIDQRVAPTGRETHGLKNWAKFIWMEDIKWETHDGEVPSFSGKFLVRNICHKKFG